MSDTDKLLAERGKTHGRFEDHARCARLLKMVLDDECYQRARRGQPPLSYEQREALSMIMHKVGRILAGDADYADHWDDIAGYARLCSKPTPVVSEPRAFTNARENFPGPCPDLDQECCGAGDCVGCSGPTPRAVARRPIGVVWADGADPK